MRSSGRIMGNWPEHIRKSRDLARFWKNTAVQGDCIVWIGQRNRGGYGKFTTTIYPKIQSHHIAHRWIYQEILGRVSSDIVVMHTCDNPACVKLQHLDSGTVKMNSEDMMSKGRGDGQFLGGEAHPSARLTEEQVLKIRALRAEGLTHQKIASLFSLTREAVRDICNGKRWRHLR
jgi:hypothetical protein